MLTLAPKKHPLHYLFMYTFMLKMQKKENGGSKGSVLYIHCMCWSVCVCVMSASQYCIVCFSDTVTNGLKDIKIHLHADTTIPNFIHIYTQVPLFSLLSQSTEYLTIQYTCIFP